MYFHLHPYFIIDLYAYLVAILMFLHTSIHCSPVENPLNTDFSHWKILEFPLLRIEGNVQEILEYRAKCPSVSEQNT